MIGRLHGVVVLSDANSVLLDVNGVGYIVHCSQGTLAGLPSPGKQVTLYTDLLVRDDLLQLSGFLHPTECELYRMLLTVQGVGVKAAQSIVGTLGVQVTIRAISSGDWGSITSAKHIGKRISQRIVNELREKVPDLVERTKALGTAVQVESEAGTVNTGGTEVADIPETGQAMVSSSHVDSISALVNLGYSRMDAAEAVALATREGEDLDTAQMIRWSLRVLARKSER